MDTSWILNLLRHNGNSNTTCIMSGFIIMNLKDSNREFPLWHNGSVASLAGLRVQSLAWHRRLRIWRSCSFDLGRDCSLDLIPDLGTTYPAGQPKREKKVSNGTILENSIFISLFLRPLPWHMEVSRLRFKLELQLLAYATATAMPDPSASSTYTMAHWQCQIL